MAGFHQLPGSHRWALGNEYPKALKWRQSRTENELATA